MAISARPISREKKIEGQGGFTHSRASGKDYELASVETVGVFVELLEAGRYAKHVASATLGSLHLINCRFN
jgi:hypothetical protein